MCHEGQKNINKIASILRGNEYAMYGYFTTSIGNMRKLVKKEKLHYTTKMMWKAQYKGKWWFIICNCEEMFLWNID